MWIPSLWQGRVVFSKKVWSQRQSSSRKKRWGVLTLFFFKFYSLYFKIKVYSKWDFRSFRNQSLCGTGSWIRGQHKPEHRVGGDAGYRVMKVGVHCSGEDRSEQWVCPVALHLPPHPQWSWGDHWGDREGTTLGLFGERPSIKKKIHNLL